MKFKHPFLFFIVLVSVCDFAYSQEVDYNRIVSPSYPSDLSFEEKLVYLAWRNHPTNDVLHHQHEMAKYNKVRTNWEWMEIFSATYNINEFTINPTPETEDRALFYPRYNFGVSITPALFVQVPMNIKIAKEQVNIAKANIDGQKINLREEVLITYQNYLLAKELLDIQSVSTEEAFSRFSLSEQRFKNGEITLEQYNNAVGAYNDERKAKLTAQTNFNILKITLEGYIGVPLEMVK